MAVATVTVALVAGAFAVAIDARAAVPPTPGGWALTFAGGAGSLPFGTNWQLALGHSCPGGPADRDTGEIAAHTNNPADVWLPA